ncbi:DVUA0089 family protein [Methylomonas rosea]|uniref:DVUA0089 family protein n=1 Tax=Methylomonas rosea TaxID=2952227 RepID=A0ABT1TPX6_9GAMM|nr:DVUA0089 family protein [Methylomonas sp. WSC-7]MCQ8116537.1 DVUA0089 family protein [Methylomonas sp. WSC-7]
MKKILVIAALAGAAALPGPALPAAFDFNGSFAQDNDVVRFDFNLGLPGAVTLFTSSWLGGGFDPILTLWDGGGNQILEQDDGSLGGALVSNGVTYNYGEFDSYINMNLAAGNYIATLTQYDNFSVSTLLADGFLRDTDPVFTAAFACSNGRFCEGSLFDSNNNPVEPNRTAAWDVHILNVDSASVNSVPEPPTWMLLSLSGLFLLIGHCSRASTAKPVSREVSV